MAEACVVANRHPSGVKQAKGYEGADVDGANLEGVYRAHGNEAETRNHRPKDGHFSGPELVHRPTDNWPLNPSLQA